SNANRASGSAASPFSSARTTRSRNAAALPIAARMLRRQKWSHTGRGRSGCSGRVSWRTRLRPFHHWRQRREDRLDIAAGLEPEDRAAVVEQVEFDIAAAAHELFLALGLAPWLLEIAPHQLGIDVQEGAAHILREGEFLFPIAGVEII